LNVTNAIIIIIEKGENFEISHSISKNAWAALKSPMLQELK